MSVESFTFNRTLWLLSCFYTCKLYLCLHNYGDFRLCFHFAMAFHSCMCCCTEPLATAASHPVPSNMHSKQMYLWCGLVSRRPMCSSAVNECVNKCVSPCLCALVGVLAGPAAASQTGELWLHVPTHKERQKADTDFFFFWQHKLTMQQYVFIHLILHNIVIVDLSLFFSSNMFFLILFSKKCFILICCCIQVNRF